MAPEQGEQRKLAAILVSDVVGYSRLAGADEDRILARLRTLRSDLNDPTIAVHHGRVVKRTPRGDLRCVKIVTPPREGKWREAGLPEGERQRID
jgi:hypothetical protein